MELNDKILQLKIWLSKQPRYVLYGTFFITLGVVFIIIGMIIL